MKALKVTFVTLATLAVLLLTRYLLGSPKLTTTGNKPLSLPSEVEDKENAQREVDRLWNNQLEDIRKESRVHGHKATKVYSAAAPGQPSKVSVEPKTWWDWSQLVIIPLVIALVGVGFPMIQNLSNSRIADNQQQETTLQTYLDNMSDLLLNPGYHLGHSNPGEMVRQVARERTLTTLRRLDVNHRGIVLRFLQDARLVGTQDAVINLSNADLSNEDLSGIDLHSIDLNGDNFSGSNLQGADLYGSDLINATLGNANLNSADLGEARLSNASLNSANLENAHLSNALLDGANLRNATLSGAHLSDTDLNGADLSYATFNSAHLNSANLSYADLSGASLNGADLSYANLYKVINLTRQQLDTVSSCTNANSLPTIEPCSHGARTVTLTYWYTEDPQTEAGVIKPLIHKFEQQNPNIQINAVYKPFFQTQAAFITAAQTGTAPDVLRSAVDWVTPFASQHYLLNIDSYIPNRYISPQYPVTLSNYLQDSLSYDKYNGHLYGLPQGIDFLALLYNQNEFNTASIHSPPKTMTALQEDAEQIVQRKAAPYGFETSGTAYYALPFLWASGGDLIGQQNKVQVSNSGSIKGLSFLLNLQNIGVMPKQMDFSDGLTTMEDDFMNGKTAMIFDAPHAISKILSGPVFTHHPDNLGIAAVPMDPSGIGDQPRSPAGGESYVISAGTVHPAEAYKFISFMSSRSSQIYIAQQNNTLPTLLSVCNRSVSSNRIFNKFCEKDILSTARRLPAIPQGGYLFNAFDPNIRAALDGTESASAALKAVDEAWNQLLETPPMVKPRQQVVNSVMCFAR
jgi:arabinogalactan oligomer/maltooligosaccharide transport system substrate-binding protein